MSEIVNIYKDLFEANKLLLLNNVPHGLKIKREEAIHHFLEKGFPDRKSEKYKYTQLDNYFGNGYNKSIEYPKINVSVADIFRCDVPQLETHLLILANGKFYRFDQRGNLPKGVTICSLKDALKTNPQIVDQYLGKLSKNEDVYASLNTAFATDGFYIHIAKDAALDKPLQIVNLLLSEEDLLVQYRNLIILEENASANIMVCDHTLSIHHFLSNIVTEIFQEKSSKLDLIFMQNEHNNSIKMQSTYVNQESHSDSNINIFTLHGGLVRNNINVLMNGEYANNSCNGFFMADGSQHIDNFTFMHHAKANCESSQLFKGILDNEAKGIFNGRILVDIDSQKTNAYQKSNGILLSDTARMNARPQLEIYADDVKCTHGSAIGQLNDDAMFYMRSRGISKPESRLLLLHAYAYEIVEKINIEPLRERIDEMVGKRLRSELARCHNCPMHCC